MPEFRAVHWRGKWAVEWYESGKRFRRSLRVTDRADVPRAFAAFQSAHEASKRPDVITVQFAWEGYQKALGERPAAVTMGHEWRAIGAHFGPLKADSISEHDCLSYIKKRRALGRSDGTVWTELGHLRSALKWAAKKNLIFKAPSITRPERPAPRDKRLTRAEAKAFRDSCIQPHIKLFVILAQTTAARTGAILDLTWDRVDFDRREIRLDDPERTKTNKRRALVTMNQSAYEALREAAKGATSAYVIEWGGHRVGSIKKSLKSVGKRCGLPWVTAHVFRHSAASWMAEDGVPMSEIAQFLGHSDSRITERVYARFSPSYLRKAAKSLEFD